MTVFVSETAITDLPSALDLIGDAGYWHQAEWVAVRVDQLPAAFFDLATALAGEITQKFAQYGMGLAVVGDVSAYESGSTAFRDWVRESNRGRQVWFVPDLAALDRRLGGSGGE